VSSITKNAPTSQFHLRKLVSSHYHRASFMTGRRPDHTNVFDNNKCFRNVGQDNNGKGEHWVTCPGHFKNNNWTTLGGGEPPPPFSRSPSSHS
jgi:arylsulfatase A-like enzyme